MSRIIRTGKTRMTKRLHCQTIFVSRMEESQTTESSRLSLLEHIMNLLSTTMHSTRTKSILLCSLLLGLVCIANPAYADKPTVKFNKGVQGNSGKGAKSNSGKGTKPHGSQSRGSNGFTFSTKSVPSHSSKSHYRPTTQKSNSVSGHLFDRRRHSPSVQSFNNHQGHHTHNSNLRSHNSNYRSYPSNYRSHPSHQSTRLSISPYGVGLNYNTYGGRYGGISTYYRPTYSQFGSTSYRSNSLYTYPSYSNPNLPSIVPSYPQTYSQPQLIPGFNSAESLATARLLNEPASRSTRIVNSHFPQVPTSAVARSLQQRAEQAFRSGDYANSDELVQQVLRLDNNNGRLLLFAAQTSFAVGDYSRATSQIDQATSTLPSDAWDFVVGNFRSYYGRNDYVAQTDRLNQHITEQPTDAFALALRGYHYGALGYAAHASKDLEKAISLDPNQGLAKRLLSAFGVNPVTIDPAEIQAPIPAEIPPMKLPGTSKVIQLIPQFTDTELKNAVPIDGSSATVNGSIKTGKSILIDGPAK